MFQLLLPILGNILSNVVDRVLPGDNPEIAKIKLQMQQELNTAMLNVNLEQLKINAAEAGNPNRTWLTWREALGYICVFAVAYHFIFQPMIAFGLSACGVVFVLPTLETANLMSILAGMLGIHYTDSRFNSPEGSMPNVPKASVGGRIAPQNQHGIDYSKGRVVDGAWVPDGN